MICITITQVKKWSTSLQSILTFLFGWILITFELSCTVVVVELSIASLHESKFTFWINVSPSMKKLSLQLWWLNNKLVLSLDKLSHCSKVAALLSE